MSTESMAQSEAKLINADAIAKMKRGVAWAPGVWL